MTLYHHVYVAENLTFVRTIMFVFIVSTIVFGVLVLWSVRRRKLHVSIVCLVSLLQYVLRREDANLVFALLTFRMLVFLHPCVNTFVVYSTKTGADLGGGCRGCAPLPEMTCGFLIQLVFCNKKTMWFIGVEVEQETSEPPPKKILDTPLLIILINKKIKSCNAKRRRQ